MITYFEGVDGSGKTTLVKSLKDYGYIEATAPWRKDDKYEELLAWYDFNFMYGNSRARWVVDRGPVTEWVYRFVRQDCPTYLGLRDLDALLRGHQVVLCMSKNSFERSMRRGEDNITNKELHDKIKRQYVECCKMLQQFCGVDVLFYSTDKPGIGTELLEFLHGGIKNGI